IDRRKGFVARWTPSNMSESVVVAIIQVALSGASATITTLTCEFETTAGMGVVPPSVLNGLNSSGTGSLTSVAIGGGNERSSMAGEFSIAISMMTGGLSGLADVN